MLDNNFRPPEFCTVAKDRPQNLIGTKLFGKEVAAMLRPELKESQKKPAFEIGGALLARIACGQESGEAGDYVLSEDDATCIQCGAPSGFYHLLGCESEECPKCHSQAISCQCSYGDSETWR
jgi:hypothetical protein